MRFVHLCFYQLTALTERMQAFNEELDSMYNDANLPEDEAWTAMTKDLKATKEARNTLAQENSCVASVNNCS